MGGRGEGGRVEREGKHIINRGDGVIIEQRKGGVVAMV
jgi:hypothetical protein